MPTVLRADFRSTPYRNEAMPCNMLTVFADTNWMGLTNFIASSTNVALNIPVNLGPNLFLRVSEP